MKHNASRISRTMTKIKRYFIPDFRTPMPMIRRIPAQGPGRHAEAIADQSEGKVSFDFAEWLNRQAEG